MKKGPVRPFFLCSVVFIVVKNIIRKIIKEVSGAGISGAYSGPLVLGPQQWNDKQVGPFTEPVYDYTNAELAYQEADGDFTESPEKRKKIEQRTEMNSKMNMKKKRLYIDMDWLRDVSLGDFLIVEAYKLLDAETYTDVYNDRMLK